MPFESGRLRGLLKAKGLRQDELEGITRVTVTKCLNGHKKVSLEDAKRLAIALDATIDYLAGLGETYESFEAAAAQMSFDVFSRALTTSQEQRDQCGRVLAHQDAPRTAKAWQAFSEMVVLAVGPTPPRIGVVAS